MTPSEEPKQDAPDARSAQGAPDARPKQDAPDARSTQKPAQNRVPSAGKKPTGSQKPSSSASKRSATSKAAPDGNGSAPAAASAPTSSSGPIQSWLAPRLERAELSRRLHLLRWHVVLVVAFIAMGLGGAVAYLSVAHKTYQAQANLLVTPVAEDDPNLLGLPLVRDTSDPTADVLTVSNLVTSPEVASLVSRQLGGTPSTLLSRVTATPVSQSQIIAVQATGSTPHQAANLANAFAQQTVQERTDVLHAQLARMIPPLKASIRQEPAADRAGLQTQLAIFQTLAVAPDPTLRVTSTAAPPTSPSSPKKTLSLAAGGFAGLVVGILTVLALQAVDPKLREEEQLRELYDLPLLARIPRQRAGRVPLTPGELSPVATESFRTLRSAFSLKHRTGDRGHAVLITGDTAGAGKTTVALNLAAALAAAGKHVILVEADLRRPSIGQALRVTAPKGLASVLFGEIELVDALITTRWHGPQLELLLAGNDSASQVDRISPERARQLVQEARDICDFLIIDSPPLTDITDALPLAEEVDDVLLVARIGTSQLRKLTDLGELLIRQRIRPAGVAILCPPDRERGYYYSYQAEAPALWGLLRKRANDERDDDTGTGGTSTHVPVNGAAPRNGDDQRAVQQPATTERGAATQQATAVSANGDAGLPAHRNGASLG